MTDTTVQSRTVAGALPERKPADVAETSHRLNALGDFVEVGGDDRQVQVVTHINHTRGWSDGNPVLGEPPVTYPINTPVVETLHPQELRHAIESNPPLMEQYLFGKFDGLVQSGFLSDITPTRSDVAAAARKEIDQAIAALNPQDGNDRYQLARAVLAKVALDPKATDALALARNEYEKDSWVPAKVPAGIALAIAGDATDQAKVFAEGMRLAGGEYRFSIVSGWALLAGSATSETERTQAYRKVMESIDTKWLDMAGEVHKAAAILAPDAESYQRSAETLAQTKYYAIANGALVGAAISASSPDERQKMYEAAQPYLHSQRRDETMAGLVALALTAATPQERQAAFNFATTYADRASFHNALNGAAMLAFGILAAPSREVANQIAAGSIEYDD